MVQATSFGAYDFIEKPDFGRVLESINDAIEERYKDQTEEESKESLISELQNITPK